MLILLTIVVIAVAVLFFGSAQRGRTVALCVGVLCLALGARAAALLSDSYSDAFVSSLHAQESFDAAEPADAALPASDVPAEVASDEDMADADADDAASQDPAAQLSDAEPARALSDEPVIGIVTDVEYLTERPDWVETRPNLEGDVHRLPIDSGLYTHVQAADRALLEQLQETIAEYIDDHVGKTYASKLVRYNIQRVGDASNPKYELVLGGQVFDISEEFFREQVRVSVGVMHQAHVLVKIDQPCRDALDHNWSEIIATYRLLQTGLAAGVVLLLLGTVFSYFKLDTATRGYYTGRLQFGAAAAILALIAASVVLGKWIPWL